MILILIVILGLSLGFIIPAVISEKSLQEADVAEPKINYSNYTMLVPMRENVCEECHQSGKKFIPQAERIKEHIDGGAYCFKCHRISHENHPMDKNVTCEKCHLGPVPKIPSSSIVCGNCHSFPEALSPSYGNLILIHRPRGINCVVCHTGCTRCHEEILSN
ncbi:MAG TPA: hypothetical protein VIO11_00065, partial [Candidatus Methanoperedens sp.]